MSAMMSLFTRFVCGAFDFERIHIRETNVVDHIRETKQLTDVDYSFRQVHWSFICSFWITRIPTKTFRNNSAVSVYHANTPTLNHRQTAKKSYAIGIPRFLLSTRFFSIIRGHENVFEMRATIEINYEDIVETDRQTDNEQRATCFAFPTAVGFSFKHQCVFRTSGSVHTFHAWAMDALKSGAESLPICICLSGRRRRTRRPCWPTETHTLSINARQIEFEKDTYSTHTKRVWNRDEQKKNTTKTDIL